MSPYIDGADVVVPMELTREGVPTDTFFSRFALHLTTPDLGDVVRVLVEVPEKGRFFARDVGEDQLLLVCVHADAAGRRPEITLELPHRFWG